MRGYRHRTWASGPAWALVLLLVSSPPYFSGLPNLLNCLPAAVNEPMYPPPGTPPPASPTACPVAPGYTFTRVYQYPSYLANLGPRVAGLDINDFSDAAAICDKTCECEGFDHVGMLQWKLSETTAFPVDDPSSTCKGTYVRNNAKARSTCGEFCRYMRQRESVWLASGFPGCSSIP